MRFVMLFLPIEPGRPASYPDKAAQPWRHASGSSTGRTHLCANDLANDLVAGSRPQHTITLPIGTPHNLRIAHDEPRRQSHNPPQLKIFSEG